jgi:hypothetical protein
MKSRIDILLVKSAPLVDPLSEPREIRGSDRCKGLRITIQESNL